MLLINSLSILIPNYNCVCADLVLGLQKQAEALSLKGLWYEIIVADDGSTDARTVDINRVINTFERCSYIINKENRGRAAIRNFLAERGRGEWMLYVDSGNSIPSDSFLANYLSLSEADVVCGGIVVGRNDAVWKGNLRYKYELKEEGTHTAAMRSLRPYREFCTCNFMVRRSVVGEVQFDERFTGYGYEDVLFGKRLAEKGVKIFHTDNPVSRGDFEANDVYIRKVEQALQTVVDFADELDGYSNIAHAAARITRIVPASLICRLYKLTRPFMLRNLIGYKPSLTVFKLYKLGCYLTKLKG